MDYNPFENVPYTADTARPVDKQLVSALNAATERLESVVKRGEAVIRNQEELACSVFEAFLNDDGTMKDLAHTAETRSILGQASLIQNQYAGRIESAVKSIPSGIEAHMCKEDRERLDRTFIRWKDIIRFHLPLVLSIGAVVGLSIMGGIMLSSSANHRKQEYEHRLDVLRRWEQDNTEAMAFGHFYRENYPRKYREWQTGRWQQDIDYRDSLIRAYNINQLKCQHK